MNQTLKNGIIKILAANILNLGFNLITNFALPKYLSFETYASIKTYQLYIGYIGVLHLGFIDGLYLEYGGKSYNCIDADRWKNGLQTLRFFQIILSIGLFLFSVCSKNKLAVYISLSLMPYNMLTCFKSLMQALGEFKKYSRVVNANTILIFVLNILLLFAVRQDTDTPYLMAYFLTYTLLWIVLEIDNLKSIGKSSDKPKFKFSLLKKYIKSGIFLMLGNFSSLILTSMDRWFTKILLNNIAFAEYSFAVSIEGFVNIAVTPLTTTLYNFFCYEHNDKEITRIRNCVLIFASFLITLAFPAKFLICKVVSKYQSSINVMFYLFAAQLFFIVIKSIYVNLYKAQKRQTIYSLRLGIVIIMGLIFNILGYLILQRKEAFSIGTLLSGGLWYAFCINDFKQMEHKYNEIVYLIILIASFILLGIYVNSIIGFIIYIIIDFGLLNLLLKKDFAYLINYFKRFIKKKKLIGVSEGD